MSKLNIDQKTIFELFSDKKADYTESDIDSRQESIIDTFVDFLKQNNLTK